MRRLKTLRRPPIYPKTPGHLPCSSLTHPLPLSSRRPSVSFGGFGLSRHARPHRALGYRIPGEVFSEATALREEESEKRRCSPEPVLVSSAEVAGLSLNSAPILST